MIVNNFFALSIKSGSICYTRGGRAHIMGHAEGYPLGMRMLVLPAKRVGIDLSGRPNPTIEAPAAKRWMGVIDGKIYHDVSVEKDFGEDKYSIIQVKYE